MNLDFLNQFLLATWGAGCSTWKWTARRSGSTWPTSTLLPGLTDLTITTEALLPPVAVPDGVDAMLELQLGDPLLTLYNGDAVSGNEMIQVYVSAFIEMDIDANADGTSLNPELGDMDLYFDVVIPEANTVGAVDTEALLELLVPLLLLTHHRCAHRDSHPRYPRLRAVRGQRADGRLVGRCGGHRRRPQPSRDGEGREHAGAFERPQIGPDAEFTRSDAARAVRRMADASGLFAAHFEHRLELELPEWWCARCRPRTLPLGDGAALAERRAARNEVPHPSAGPAGGEPLPFAPPSGVPTSCATGWWDLGGSPWSIDALAGDGRATRRAGTGRTLVLL